MNSSDWGCEAVVISQFSFESLIEDGAEEGVEFCGGLGLQVFQRVHLCLQRVQLGHDPALLGERWRWNFQIANIAKGNVRACRFNLPAVNCVLGDWAQ